MRESVLGAQAVRPALLFLLITPLVVRTLYLISLFGLIKLLCEALVCFALHLREFASCS